MVRPLGIALSLTGNVLFAFGFGGLLGAINDMADRPTLHWTMVIPVLRPCAMLAFGSLLLRLAPRFGGGSLGVQFLVIAVTSMWSALHAVDGVERFVNFTIGGSFLLASLVGLVGYAMAFGWRHSMVHPGPLILRASSHGGLVPPDSLTDEQRRMVLGRLVALEQSGVLSAEQIAAIKRWQAGAAGESDTSG